MADSLENEDSKGKIMIIQITDMRTVKKQMRKGNSSYCDTHMTPPTYRGNSRFSSFRGGPDVPLIGGPPSSCRTPSWLSLLTFTECQ